MSKKESTTSNTNSPKWATPQILLTVATSLTNDEPFEINFAKTLGQKKHVTKAMHPEDAYWLPRQYSKNTPQYRANVVAPIFVTACQQAGFLVLMKEHVPLPGNRCKVTFVCSRFRFHKATAPERTTLRAIKGQGPTCGFKFNIYFDAQRQRWFVPRQQAGSNEHRGHVPLAPNQVNVGLYRPGWRDSNTTTTAVATTTTMQHPIHSTTNTTLARAGAGTGTGTAGVKRKATHQHPPPPTHTNPHHNNNDNNIARVRDDYDEGEYYGRLLPLYQEMVQAIPHENAYQECKILMQEIRDKMMALQRDTTHSNVVAPTPTTITTAVVPTKPTNTYKVILGTDEDGDD